MNIKLRKHLLFDALASFIMITSFVSAVFTILCRVFIPISYTSIWLEIITLFVSICIGVIVAKNSFMKFDIWMHKHIYKSGV